MIFILSGNNEYLIQKNIEKICNNGDSVYHKYVEESLIYLKENSLFLKTKISIIDDLNILNHNLSFLDDDSKILIVIDKESKVKSYGYNLIDCQSIDYNDFIYSLFKKDGYVCEKELVEFLSFKYNNNLFKLEKIIEKLKLFSNIDVVTKNDFKNIGDIENDYEIFNIFSLLIDGKKEKILNLLDDMNFFQVKKIFIINLERMIKIISMLNNEFKEIKILKKVKINRFYFNNLKRLAFSLSTKKLLKLYLKIFEIENMEQLKEFIIEW